MTNNELINIAIEAMNNSYSPYSDFKVGAALLTKCGKVFSGCNIENSSYSATNCAERTAVYKAVSEGYRRFEKIVIVGGKNGIIEDYTHPCGVCRQVLSEFCDTDFTVIVAKSPTEFKEYRLTELIPHSFTSDNIGG